MSSPSDAAKRDDATPTLTLSDSSSDIDDPADSRAQSPDNEMRDADRDDSPSANKRPNVNSDGTKRKRKVSPSSTQSAAKKVKADTPTASTDKAKATVAGESKGKSALVELKGSKFDFKQKPAPVNLTLSYLSEMAAFLDYAVARLTYSEDAKLDEWPEAHHPLISKLVHESPNMLDGVFRTVKRALATAIAGRLSSLADSDDSNIEELSEEEIGARIMTPPLKAVITSLATRTNYGLALNDIDDLPEGVKDVPLGLQIWCWEVKNEDHWPSEMRAKLDRRRKEREEVKAAAVALFQQLSEGEQDAVLSGTAKAKGKPKAAAEDNADNGEADGQGDNAKKSKGKGTANAKLNAEGSGDAGDIPKPSKPKPKKEKKEPTEQEKREAEEKARLKAEKEAQKEARLKERDEKRAKKAEEDAKKLERKTEKDRAKAEKEEEERKRLEAKKKQTNIFSSFFVKPATSPAPEAAGPSDSPRSGKAKDSDFDRVFHPFTVREKVTVAPINRFRPNTAPPPGVEIDSLPDLTLKDSLASFLSTASRRRIPPYDPHPCPPVNVRQCVVAINDSTLTSSDTTVYYQLLEDRSKVRVKLFKFHEDVRPGYVGTWTKTSHVIGPRTPLARETALLNYDVDSEIEWEEEVDDPDAEDVGSDGARSDDEADAGGGTETGAESDADSWLADDDEIEYEEGYDADGDVAMLAAEGRTPLNEDEDIIVVEEKEERRKRERDVKKKKADRERKKREREAKRGPMLPVAKGLCWQSEVDTVEDAAFIPMRIQFLNDASAGLDPFTWVSKPFASTVVQKSASSATTSVGGAMGEAKGKENVAIGGGFAAPAELAAATAHKTSTTAFSAADGAVNMLKAKRAPPKQPFPPELLARFVRHVHGSTKSRPVLVELFIDAMKEEGVAINKNTVDAKYRELGVKKVKGVAQVAADVLAQVGIAVD